MTLDRVLFCVGRENLEGLQVVSLDSPTPVKTDVEDIDFICLFQFHTTRFEGQVSCIEIRSEPLPSPKYSPDAPFTADIDRRMLFLPILLRRGVAQMVIVSGEFLMEHLKPLPSTAKKQVSLEEIWSSGRMPFTVVRLLEGFSKIWVCNIYGSRMINMFIASSPMFYTLDCNRVINSRTLDRSNSHNPQLPADTDGSTSTLLASLDLRPAFERTGSSLPQLPLVQHGPFELLQVEKLDQCKAAMMSEDNIVFIDSVCCTAF